MSHRLRRALAVYCLWRGSAGGDTTAAAPVECETLSATRRTRSIVTLREPPY